MIDAAVSDFFRHPPDLQHCLRELIAQVPCGRVTTCGDLARALGNIAASRWIGKFLRGHPHDQDCNCHRVVLSDGELGGYVTGDVSVKARLLRREGVLFDEHRVELTASRFDAFTSDEPLEQLARQQTALLQRLSVRDEHHPPALVAGVDVSYAGEEGVAAYTLVDLANGELLWTNMLRRRVAFPYITSYLAYRELPLLLELLDVARREDRLADIVLVDGSGVLHPRGAGVASQLGIVADVPTIGVTKKLLCGRVDLERMAPGETRPITIDERQVGVAIRHRPKSPRPLFVSPGHRVSVATAEAVTRRLLLGRSLPEPIYWADRLSRREAKAL
ncbi:MAG: endonuclease V [Pirellulaceae bacterium]